MRKIVRRKLVLTALLLSVGFWVKREVVRANEGRVRMKSGEVSCEALSVWQDDSYRVMGKCQGLVYPYGGKYDRYYVWGRDVAKGGMVRLGEVNRGYFEGRMRNEFDKLVITAEMNSSPRKPSQKIVASGLVEKWETGEKETVVREEPVFQQEESKATMTVQDKGVETAKTTGTTAGKVIGKIVTSLLAIVFIVVGIVIVGSLVFRKKGSVS